LVNIVKAHTTHGLSKHPLYKVWNGIKQRCRNPKCFGYKDYGGRGISYSPEWENFEVFFVDVVKGYKKGLQLDRINNDGNYEPGNVRWADRVQQMRNVRTNRRIEYKGEVLTLAEWAESLDVEYNRFYGYVYRYSFEEAYKIFTKGYIWKYA
jgi:hypothetical protein